MARTYQKPLSKCQAEKNAITSKQITSDKGEKQIENGKFNSYRNPTMLQVFICSYLRRTGLLMLCIFISKKHQANLNTVMMQLRKARHAEIENITQHSTF